MAFSRTKIIIPLFFLLGLILVYMLQNPYQAVMMPLAEGKIAPDFSLKDLQGKEVRLSDYRGQLVFLNFWATWCPPCRDEMPGMEKLKQTLQDRSFVMLAVSVDNDPEHVELFQKSFGYTFPILMDPEQKIATLYQTTGVPETFLIGEDGTILYKIIGPRDWMGPDSTTTLESMLP